VGGGGIAQGKISARSKVFLKSGTKNCLGLWLETIGDKGCGESEKKGLSFARRGKNFVGGGGEERKKTSWGWSFKGRFLQDSKTAKGTGGQGKRKKITTIEQWWGCKGDVGSSTGGERKKRGKKGTDQTCGTAL